MSAGAAELERVLRSPRLKSALQVSAGLWMHHLELFAEADIDDEVIAWLQEAYDAAS